MCHCLAKAIKMHLDFNSTDAYFLQDLPQDILDFTYNFQNQLKVTLHPQLNHESTQNSSNILSEN